MVFVGRNLKTILNKLHRQFGDPSKVITLEVKDLTDANYFGMCTTTAKGWTIEIDDSLDFGMQIYMLAHEYAHTMVPYFDKRQHGPSWGVAFAAVYSFLFDKELVVRKVRKRNHGVRRSHRVNP
jgi:hypothetical protein